MPAVLPAPNTAPAAPESPWRLDPGTLGIVRKNDFLIAAGVMVTRAGRPPVPDAQALGITPVIEAVKEALPDAIGGLLGNRKRLRRQLTAAEHRAAVADARLVEATARRAMAAEEAGPDLGAALIKIDSERRDATAERDRARAEAHVIGEQEQKAASEIEASVRALAHQQARVVEADLQEQLASLEQEIARTVGDLLERHGRLAATVQDRSWPARAEARALQLLD